MKYEKTKRNQVSVESPEDFVCPPKDERFSEPDLRDHQREKDFKEGKGFVYYQHLRKAGGTGFCEMASRYQFFHFFFFSLLDIFVKTWDAFVGGAITVYAGVTHGRQGLNHIPKKRDDWGARGGVYSCFAFLSCLTVSHGSRRGRRFVPTSTRAISDGRQKCVEKVLLLTLST